MWILPMSSICTSELDNEEHSSPMSLSSLVACEKDPIFLYSAMFNCILLTIKFIVMVEAIFLDLFHFLNVDVPKVCISGL